ncbi:GNAT family N-acetyltransferase, partial [Vibrio nigripulchritudo]|uniref:GNAT family N-acetyltransferase n=1 Tax=Vibrio nigripulchritudo TaxID=28173 RepID=UPI0030B88BA9
KGQQTLRNSMNKQAVRAQYNQFERIDINLTGYQKFDTGKVVRLVSEQSGGSLIAYFDLDERSADAAIEEEMEYFRKLNRSFEWKVYDYDSPSDITKRLVEKGFVADDPESFMVLDLTTIEAHLPVPDQVIEVTDEKGIRDAIWVQEQVWKEDLSEHFDYLNNFKQTQPDQISIYVVYSGEQPVSSGWITYNGDSPFAGIWGGSTLESQRGKGCYTALLHQRINEARSKGIRYLTIDASDMSRPIAQKHGFELVAITTPYTYTPNNENE